MDMEDLRGSVPVRPSQLPTTADVAAAYKQTQEIRVPLKVPPHLHRGGLPNAWGPEYENFLKLHQAEKAQRRRAPLTRWKNQRKREACAELCSF